MSASFVYAVLAAPITGVSFSNYCVSTNHNNLGDSCESNWGQPRTSCVGNLQGILVGPSCSGSNFGPACPVYNCLAVTSSGPIKCGSGKSPIYDIMLSQNKIPLIGGNDPSKMGSLATNSGNQLNPLYAAPTDIATSGNWQGANCNTGAGSTTVPNGAIVLAYPLSWFQSWTDLDAFLPTSFGGTSIFLNTGTQNYTYNGWNIPQLEDQIGPILQNFCAQTSTSCLSGINPLPTPQPGGPTTYGYCSNIFAKRTDNGTNYCNLVYQNLLTDVYPASATAAIDVAIGNYCQGPFPNPPPGQPSGSTVPPECLCANPMGSPYYQAISQAAQGANINVNNPFTSDSGFNETFGNVGCWWFPCQTPQNTLVPVAVQAPQQSGSCPDVCANVVKIINNGDINLSGATINQSINCCAPNSPYYSGPCNGPAPPSTCNPACTTNQTCINGKCVAQSCASNSDCSSGQQCQGGVCVAPCTIDSDCPADEMCSNGACVPKTPPSPSPSIFKKYWWVFLIGLIFLLLLFGLLLWYLLK